MGDLGPLRGWEKSPLDQVGRGREGGGEEKWRWDGTGTPGGELGEGRGSHARRHPLIARGSAGKERDLHGIRGLEGNAASTSPSPSGPHEPAGTPGLNPCPRQGLSWWHSSWA